ncbi:MAG TPA: electron transfer flavoprotein subunit alpha/FixB family protein, partial [Deltaproteobacteria bacterium]|nr:electron transfer flavoprotein subunit alpha/FixB family protein [Deltaproteobacteria bacterium]
MVKRILIIAETDAAEVKPVTYELVTLAAAIGPDHIELFALGRGPGEAAKEIAERTGLPVTAVATCAEYAPELWKEILSRIIPGRSPDLIIIAHTACGQDFAPGLAVSLGASCITAVESFSHSGADLSFTRSVLNGKALMDIVPAYAPCVLTILPGAFEVYSTPPIAPGPVETVSSDSRPCKVLPRGLTRPEEEDAIPITEASVVVSAGRGIGKPENLELVERLAARFKHSAVGGSRPLCDLGWLPYRQQVGLTGATVAPKLYIA